MRDPLPPSQQREYRGGGSDWRTNNMGYRYREVSLVGEDGPVPAFTCRDPQTGLQATRESYGEALGALRDLVRNHLEKQRFPWKGRS